MDERTVGPEQGNRNSGQRIGFKPRFIPPEKTNDCYYSNKNIFHRAGYGLPNCTAYAYGRILENAPSKSFKALTGNGGKWYDQAVKAGYKVGTEPKLGAIICWTSKGAGHVAVVEKYCLMATLFALILHGKERCFIQLLISNLRTIILLDTPLRDLSIYCKLGASAPFFYCKILGHFLGHFWGTF